MIRLSRGYVLAAALGLILYVPGIWWGLPYIDGRAPERGWAIDDETPLGALAEARHAVVRDGAEGRNVGYPLFYYYASVAAYTPYLGYLAATGQFSAPTGSYPFGLANATRALQVMSLISKALTVLFALATVFGAYHAARHTWNARAGRFAALLVSLMYPVAYYARTGNLDVPMLGLVALGLANYAAIVRYGITRATALALGVAAGLAVATKDSAVGIFAAVPLAVFAMPRQAGAVAWKLWALAAVAAFLALGVGSGLFIDPANYIEHIRFLLGRVEEVPGSQTVSAAFPMTMAGHGRAVLFQLRGSADMLTLAGFILAIAGVVRFVPRNRQATLLLLPALTYTLFVFVLLRADMIRYLLPSGFVLALFAGAAADAALASGSRILALGGRMLFTVAASVLVLRAVDLTHAMMRDSRYDAARFLATRLSPGDRVEYFGASQKLPQLPAGVTVARATDYRGMHFLHDTSAARAASIAAEWHTRRPAAILVIPDHSSPWPGAPFDGSMPPSLFRALEAGDLPWRRVARFETQPLLPWIRRRPLDYPMVNPPVHVYALTADRRSAAK